MIRVTAPRPASRVVHIRAHVDRSVPMPAGEPSRPSSARRRKLARMCCSCSRCAIAPRASRGGDGRGGHDGADRPRESGPSRRSSAVARGRARRTWCSRSDSPTHGTGPGAIVWSASSPAPPAPACSSRRSPRKTTTPRPTGRPAHGERRRRSRCAGRSPRPPGRTGGRDRGRLGRRGRRHAGG